LEAIELARALDDRWRLSQILAWQANTGLSTGDLIAAGKAGEEGRAIADEIGDRANSRQSGLVIGWALLVQGKIPAAISEFRTMTAECEQCHDDVFKATALMGWGMSLAHHGELDASAAIAAVALQDAADLGDYFLGMAHAQLAQACLAAGDLAAAHDAAEAAWREMRMGWTEGAVAQRAFNSVDIALARGDLADAREMVDAAVAVAKGWHLVAALLARARVATAEGVPADGERDAHDALACAAERGIHLHIPDILELLAGLATDAANNHEAVRLFGAAQGLRGRMGLVRLKIYDAAFEASVAELRDRLDENAFNAAWAEGEELSLEDAIAYAQRGRGERRRPASGWASLTPAERDVARLACEGLANKEIAARLFVSPRTVQAHLSHIYAKLDIASRVQLVQEAARNA
jgi:DNA-binding CsgD family transcriptional regulator